MPGFLDLLKHVEKVNTAPKKVSTNYTTTRTSFFGEAYCLQGETFTEKIYWHTTPLIVLF